MSPRAGVENRMLCSTCGGKCCQRGPGICHPADIEGEYAQRFLDLVGNRFYCIDSYSCDKRLGDPPTGGDRGLHGMVLMVRPRMWHRYRLAVDFTSDQADYAECKLWSPQYGCSIQELRHRPYQCRVVVPRKTKCEMSDDRLGDELFLAWMEVQTEIAEAYFRIVNPPEVGTRTL